MIGLDTNVLARYFVEETDADADADAVTLAQREAAQRLIESGDALFVPKQWSLNSNGCSGATTDTATSRWAR